MVLFICLNKTLEMQKNLDSLKVLSHEMQRMCRQKHDNNMNIIIRIKLNLMSINRPSEHKNGIVVSTAINNVNPISSSGFKTICLNLLHY